ncbi:hypothetical protein EV421DRAFT_1914869 [Armillaria borealis]|uniref:Uncharacterized protein n=1 Tax=Armillaria borealis TaxID=47425 RepID=A0AA39M5P2_9AGAR|nr:hypothetical protein EV421DRAFT_1914869 [Armillaria borealis]
MTTTTTNVATRAAFQESSPPGLPSPYEGPHNLKAVDIKGTGEQFDEGAASEEEGKDSEDEWHEALTLEYMAAHEPFAALPLDYLLITGWARAPPKFALGIGVRDMDDGYDLALRLVPNEPVKNPSKLLGALLDQLRDRTNLTLRATPVRSKEVGFVFYIATSWDDDFNGIPAQRDTINAMLSEINWRDKIKWYLVGVWADKWREDYNKAVRKCDT